MASPAAKALAEFCRYQKGPRTITALEQKRRMGLFALAALSACPTVAAQVTRSPLTGSFVMFDRNLNTVQMWQQELATQAALGHKILILPADGTLMPSLGDTTGFTVNPQTLIYPSSIFPASPPRPDNLGMLLTA